MIFANITSAARKSPCRLWVPPHPKWVTQNKPIDLYIIQTPLQEEGTHAPGSSAIHHCIMKQVKDNHRYLLMVQAYHHLPFQFPGRNQPSESKAVAPRLDMAPASLTSQGLYLLSPARQLSQPYSCFCTWLYDGAH